MSEWQDIQDAARSAAQDVDYRLTFAATSPRAFGATGLDGPDLPDAYGGSESTPGDWVGRTDPVTETREGWVDRFAEYAIQEAVHEALEWFRVDGEQWINPHDPDYEDDVFELVQELVERLAEMRREKIERQSTA